jgi:hypothetical protein
MRSILGFLAISLITVNVPADSLVHTQRLPSGAIQPQIVQAADGAIHLIYYNGKPDGGNLFYMRKTAAENNFSKPIQINTTPGSAISIGTIRGAHLALGRNSRVHVAWMGGAGSSTTKIEGTDSTPMLYTRLADDGTRFEPERNLLTFTGRLDGGGTVAADASGNVYVTWHGAPPSGPDGESERAVYVAHSSDDGQTFRRETRSSPAGTGTCGCCGMGAFADKEGALYLLYRAATQMTNRDEFLLVSKNRGKSFQVANQDPWITGMCPMSSTSFAQGNGRTFAAWENAGKVHVVAIKQNADAQMQKLSPPGNTHRKHPALAVNSKGETLVAWTEGTGWEKGGSAGWQIFNAEGKVVGEPGSAPGVPIWGLVAAYAQADGTFVVIY